MMGISVVDGPASTAPSPLPLLKVGSWLLLLWWDDFFARTATEGLDFLVGDRNKRNVLLMGLFEYYSSSNGVTGETVPKLSLEVKERQDRWKKIWFTPSRMRLFVVISLLFVLPCDQ
jgi:hypothetical protein